MYLTREMHDEELADHCRGQGRSVKRIFEGLHVILLAEGVNEVVLRNSCFACLYLQALSSAMHAGFAASPVASAAVIPDMV